MPLEIIAKAVSCSEHDLEKDLASLMAEGFLLLKEGVCSVVSLPSLPVLADAPDILARALEELLAFIEFHQGDEAARSQVLNVVALAKIL